MKRLLYILTVLFVLGTLDGFAQNKLSNAIYSLQNNELDKAKELIDAAAVDPLFKDDARTWYYRGNIYKELFKANEANNKQSPLRMEAVSSFKKSYNLDDGSEISGSTQKNLKFLASTIFNDAAKSFTVDDYLIALENYSIYKDIISFIAPNTNFDERDIQFKLALATTYTQIANSDSLLKNEYLPKVKELYMQVLAIDSNNVSANYNMGILYYNQGADMVNNMDYSLDLEELNRVQEKLYEIFSMSLPYMKRAYDLNPNKEETLVGLQGIYIGMNDREKSDAYKLELEKLKGQDSK
jgi:tetratricopeptide (TPR) repeat protein